MLFILINITIIATATIITFADIRLDILAAMGDAAALPITRPATASQCLVLSMAKNVIELIMAIKKRESFTVPSENRGCRPPAIKVDKTMEPQPPPPTASIKPPPKPSKVTLLNLAEAVLMCVLKAFLNITIPRMRV